MEKNASIDWRWGASWFESHLMAAIHAKTDINTGDEKLGMECEVIIKSYNIANPQWTRTYEDSPDWMKLGFMML